MQGLKASLILTQRKITYCPGTQNDWQEGNTTKAMGIMFNKIIETNTSAHVKHFFSFPKLAIKRKRGNKLETFLDTVKQTGLLGANKNFQVRLRYRINKYRALDWKIIFSTLY